MRKALNLMLLCLPLTILGCSGGADPAKWDAPLVLDLTSVSCPEIDTRTRAEFRRTTPRPKPDTVDPKTGAPAVSKRATQSWIDQLELSEQRKNRAGRHLIGEHDRCRGGTSDPKSVS